MSIVGTTVVADAPRKGGGSTTRVVPAAGGSRSPTCGTPMLVLLVLFVVPMVILYLISIGLGVANQDNAWTFDHYTALFTDPLYRDVAVTTIYIATAAMVAQLVVGVPLAYVMAFKAGR